ncbi:hypothetical protein GCM10010503_04740 [Streptomyces lucensis JCM 4490]|uniref:Uncharacterized protein n=1 Tax=Streptomyces lucensis JCM 4490 TaxID=1306176 RepID=A0A918ITP4_9ACTN|nr:hypothetical protein GCM10010503_04740 [Streptomyces lucensis JCM 4490]
MTGPVAPRSAPDNAVDGPTAPRPHGPAWPRRARNGRARSAVCRGGPDAGLRCVSTPGAEHLYTGEKALGKALPHHMSSHRVIPWPLLARLNPRLPRCCCLYNLMGAASDIR